MVFLAVFVAYWLAGCAYALWNGGGPEKVAAAVIILAFPASRIASGITDARGAFKPWVFSVDLLVLGAFVLLAYRAYRLWPIAIAGMALMQVVGHVLRLADPQMFRLVYWMARAIWIYPMIALIILATIRHRARERREGIEPSWRSSLNGRVPTLLAPPND